MQREKFPFPTGSSEMAARVRAFDWSATPLGAPDTWGPELRTAAAYVLESKFPAALVWGPDLTTIYNDGFCPILGEKSETLGRPFRDIWSEAWNEIGPIAARAYAGEATFIEDFPLEVNRFGYSEQAYFTFCYSPVRLANGDVGGMIDTVVETTHTVQTRDRDRFLNQELGHRLRNMMAMVDAIAHQSLKNTAADAAFHTFRKRLAALGPPTKPCCGPIGKAQQSPPRWKPCWRCMAGESGFPSPVRPSSWVPRRFFRSPCCCMNLPRTR